MIALGFGVIWWGYLEIVYGYTLLKGWDITWKQLADPIHPYQWPAPGATIPTIPKGQILPGQASKGTTLAAPGGGGGTQFPANVQ